MLAPAIALLEFTSIAAGIQAGDAMVKRAPIDTIQTGTVQPGHYLILVSGDVASVGEAVEAGREAGQASLLDCVYLPNVHPDVVAGIAGGRGDVIGEALGVVETQTVAAAIRAADAGLKGAEVTLWQLRLADGLGGKGLALFSGRLTDIEAALHIATAQAGSQLLYQAIIPQLHTDMTTNVATPGRFGHHFDWGIA